MMRILITGASGFLGSHLMLHHLKKGDTVLGVDNFCSSDKDSEHAKLINTLCLASGKGMLIECDIIESRPGWCLTDVVEAFKLKHMAHENFDLIYNMACPASPPKYQEMPILTMMTCVAGTGAVLDLADRHDAIVVQASTSEVYGDPDVSPQHESCLGNVNSYGPRACYDEGKRAAEALCYDYLNTYKVDVRIARIFNTYGPHMDPHDGRVVSNFICQALRGEPMTVFGDGKQTRSFCYVDDMIRGLVALGSMNTNPLGPVNIGNPTELSVEGIANTISKKVTGHMSSVIRRQPLPVDDPRQRCPDISRARELLGWEPIVDLDAGLDATIGYFRNIMKR